MIWYEIAVLIITLLDVLSVFLYVTVSCHVLFSQTVKAIKIDVSNVQLSDK